MVKHSSPCLAPARERSGLEAAGYFLSKQAPVPFQPQPACPSCCSVGWRWPLGLGKHSHDLPQGAGLVSLGHSSPVPFIPQAAAALTRWDGLRTSVRRGISSAQAAVVGILPEKKQQTGEQSNMPMWQWQLLPCQPAVTATSTCWPVKIGPAIQHVLDCPGQGFSAHLTVFCRHRVYCSKYFHQ